MVTRKLDKYIEDKNRRKYIKKNQKLEANILKNVTSSSTSKNVKSY